MEAGTEVVVEVCACGETAEGGDEGDAVSGGDEQTGGILHAVGIDETTGARVVGTAADGLLHIAVVGGEHRSEFVSVQPLVGVGLLLVHQLAETVIELLPPLLSRCW